MTLAKLSLSSPEVAMDGTNVSLPDTDGLIYVPTFKNIKVKERIRYLPWLSAGDIDLVVAPRTTGKSFFVEVVSVGLTYNLPIGTWEILKTANVLYLDTEMSLYDLQERFCGITKGKGEPVKNLYLLSNEYLEEVDRTLLNLSEEKCREDLTGILKRRNIDILIIDNISSSFPGIPENSKEEWDVVSQWLLSLRRLGKSVILIHHVGKDVKKGGRGTSAREDYANTIIQLSTVPGHSFVHGASFNINFTKCRSFYGADAEPFQMSIVTNADGSIDWHTSKKSSYKSDLIIALLGSGLSQVDVASRIGCDKGHVSRARKKAITDGYLTKNNNLTKRGIEMYGSIDTSEYIQ